MSQITVPPSSTSPSQAVRDRSHGLPHSLAIALGYLDCTLEDELARYRRARSGKQVVPSSVRVMYGKAKLTSKAQVELTQFVPSETLQSPKSSPAPLATEFLDQLAVIPQDPSGETVGHEMTDMGAGEILSDGNLSYDLSEWINNPAIESLAASDDVSALYGSQYGAQDYLESSEELLRSLAQEEADEAQERNGLESLMTPFGVGSMLLMLMASGMLGYLIMNPSMFASIGSFAGRLLPKKSPPPQTAPIAAQPSDAGPIPHGKEFMDLSLNSFSVLGTQPGNAGLPSVPGQTLKGNIMPTNLAASLKPTEKVGPALPKSMTGTTAATGASAGASNPGTPLFSGGSGIFRPNNEEEEDRSAEPTYTEPRPARRSNPGRASSPAPVRTAPLSAPISGSVEAPPPPSVPTRLSNPEPAPAPAAPQYRLEKQYTSDRDLEKAQQAEPGAYFKNGENGAIIQMGGSYRTREEAEAKVQELKQRGIEGVEVAK